ncbi:MAG: transcriptional regulator [Bdellovibrionota bacterium]
MTVVEDLAQKKGLNKTALMKQCLRVYQMVETRLERGEKLFFEDDKKEKSELVLL